MVSYPWVAFHDCQKQDLNELPNAKRWHASVSERPATQRAYALVDQIASAKPGFTDNEKKVLFGQDATSVTRTNG